MPKSGLAADVDVTTTVAGVGAADAAVCGGGVGVDVGAGVGVGCFIADFGVCISLTCLPFAPEGVPAVVPGTGAVGAAAGTGAISSAGVLLAAVGVFRCKCGVEATAKGAGDIPLEATGFAAPICI